MRWVEKQMRKVLASANATLEQSADDSNILLTDSRGSLT
jgi:hypothetical protein